MESSSVSVCEAVSSVLCTLEEQRKLAYSRSSIQLVSELENKYPLSDVIMRRLAIYFKKWLAVGITLAVHISIEGCNLNTIML